MLTNPLLAINQFLQRKDINEKALSLGLEEASRLLAKQYKGQRKSLSNKLQLAMGLISPTLSYGDFSSVGLVVEAVVENEKSKKRSIVSSGR